jgi:hypothetical protein
MQILKVKDPTNLTIPDDLSIPDFLLRVLTKKEWQENKEQRLRLRTSNFRPSLPPPAERPKDPLVEQFRAEEEERRRTKTTNRITKMLERKQVKDLPPGSRWDGRRGKWVVDGLASTPKPKDAKPLMSRVVVAPAVSFKASFKPCKGKGLGIIATICELMAQPTGVSRAEALEYLIKKYPEREPASMTNTVRINTRQFSTSSAEDEKRGKVFYKK